VNLAKLGDVYTVQDIAMEIQRSRESTFLFEELQESKAQRLDGDGIGEYGRQNQQASAMPQRSDGERVG